MEMIKVLEQEVKDWQEAYNSYNNTFAEEVKDEGQASEEIKADMRMATEKINTLQQAISELTTFAKIKERLGKVLSKIDLAIDLIKDDDSFSALRHLEESKTTINFILNGEEK